MYCGRLDRGHAGVGGKGVVQGYREKVEGNRVRGRWGGMSRGNSLWRGAE